MTRINLSYYLKIVFLIYLLSDFFIAESQEKKYRILFLGNSVFYYHGGIYESFEGFCRESGLNFQTFSQRKSPENPSSTTFLGCGRIPVNLPDMAADSAIHNLIQLGDFDYVVVEARRTGYLLPEGIKLPIDRGEHIPYQKNLTALVAIHQTIVQSGAQTVLYMHPGLHTNEEARLPVAQIYHKLHEDLEKTVIDGQGHEVLLVPATYLWADAIRKYGVEGWYADKAHGNALARYASACMLFTYITDQDPRQNGFNTLIERDQHWNLINPDQTAPIEDEKWIKDRVWLYHTTRPH